jgi:hypothetical protein
MEEAVETWVVEKRDRHGRAVLAARERITASVKPEPCKT